MFGRRSPADKIVVIPDLFKPVVARVSATMKARHGFEVMYDYGHERDVTKAVKEKAEAEDEELKKRWPLIWLVMDFEETRGTKLDVYAEVRQLMFIICTPTEPADSMERRYLNTFKPVLLPVYAEFMAELSDEPMFFSPQTIEHVKVDRPYWGGLQRQEDKNLLGNVLDAIQIKNMTLQVALKKC